MRCHSARRLTPAPAARLWPLAPGWCQATYTPEEVTKARHWIHQGLKQGRIKHNDAKGARG